MTPRDYDFIRDQLQGENILTPDTTVTSECVNTYEYDVELEVLTVFFQKRGTYRYANFSLAEFTNFAQAGSLGTYFNLYIRDQYEYERIG